MRTGANSTSFTSASVAYNPPSPRGDTVLAFMDCPRFVVAPCGRRSRRSCLSPHSEQIRPGAQREPDHEHNHPDHPERTVLVEFRVEGLLKTLLDATALVGQSFGPFALEGLVLRLEIAHVDRQRGR